MSLTPMTVKLIGPDEDFTPHLVHRVHREGKSRYAWYEMWYAIKVFNRNKDGEPHDHEREV